MTPPTCPQKGADVRIEASLPESRTDIGYADGAYTVNWKTGDNIYVSAYTEEPRRAATPGPGASPYKTNAPRTYTFDGTQFAMPENGHVPAGTLHLHGGVHQQEPGDLPRHQQQALREQTQDCNAPTAHLAEYDCLIGFVHRDAARRAARVHHEASVHPDEDHGEELHGRRQDRTVAGISSNANLAGIYDPTSRPAPPTSKSGGQNSITVTLENAPSWPQEPRRTYISSWRPTPITARLRSR